MMKEKKGQKGKENYEWEVHQRMATWRKIKTEKRERICEMK